MVQHIRVKLICISNVDSAKLSKQTGIYVADNTSMRAKQ